MTQELRDLMRRRRIELGLTQVQVSERAGMSQEWASGVERGKIKYPRRESLVKLADALNLPREDVIVAAGFAPTRAGARQMLADAGDTAALPVPVPEAVGDALRRVVWTPENIEIVGTMLRAVARADERAASAPASSDMPAAPPRAAEVPAQDRR